MKRIKKLASLVLAMIMVLSMGLTVFATSATPPTDNTARPSNTPSGEGDFAITINDASSGYTYAAYQIFKGDLSVDGNGKKTLSNITWGASVDTSKVANKFKKEDGTSKTLEEILAEIEVNATGSNPDGFDSQAAKKFAADIAGCLVGTGEGDAFVPTPYRSTNVMDNGAYTIGDLDAGYYLVSNTVVPGNGDYTRYMMEVVGNVTATPKKGTLEDDKYIEVGVPDGVEGLDYFKADDAPIGGTVKYNIPVKLPENFDDYETYYLGFSDTLSKGLVLNHEDGSLPNADEYKITVRVVTGGDILTKTVDGVTTNRSVTDKDDVAAVMNAINKDKALAIPVTGSFRARVTAVAETETDVEKQGGHLIQVWTHDLKSLNTEDATVVTGGSWVILTYETKLNKDAVIGTGNPNYVKVRYSNNPNDSGRGDGNPPEGPDPEHPTGENPEKRVDTFTTELQITKVDGADITRRLQGAEFTLTGNGAEVVLVAEAAFVENDNGEYWKLKDETYTKTTPNDNNKDDYMSTTKKYQLTNEIALIEKAKSESNSVSGMVNSDGVVKFTGLSAGVYWLAETKTPPGYNTLDTFQFKIKATLSEDGKTVSFDIPKETILDGVNPGEGVRAENIEIDGDNNKFVTTIANNSGSLLPSTGGIGTTIFYVVGGILVVAAGILLVTKKRMSAR